MQKNLLVLLCGLTLAGCDQLGIESPTQVAAAKDAEGRAVGSACRHSGRSLEDCYKLNPKALKAAVFGGWRDMDAYMRENNIEVVPSVIPRDEPAKKKTSPPGTAPAPADNKDANKPVEEPAKKPGAGHTAIESPLPVPARGNRIA